MIYKIQNKRIINGPLEISYDILNGVTFTGIDIKDSDLAYIAGSLQPNLPASALLFYSEDFEIENENVIFNIDTYTENFLSGVTKIGTRIYVEIGIMNDDLKKILLFDDAIAQPRIYVEGEPPAPTPGTSYATHAWVESNFEPIISNNRKLSYSLLSGTPKINNSTITILQDGQEPQTFTLNQDMDETIHLTAGGGGGDVTSSWVEENFEYKITNENKLSYNLLSGAPSIPTVNDSQISLTINGVTSSFTLNQSSDKTIEFVVEGGGGEGVTSAYVTQKISEHNLAGDAHSSLFGAKQNTITNANKLAYSLISGTPSIPTKTSDLINDSNFATSSYVNSQLSTKQDLITNSKKLAYSLLSGTPTIPTVNNPTITFTQGGITKGSITLNQSSAQTINFDAGGGSTPGSGIITIAQGGAIKGTFNVNQSTNQTINLDAGGGGSGGEMTYYQIYSSDTVLTAYHDCSYFWALQNQNATLYAENLQQSNYDIPIDINLSGSTVTLSGMTRVGNFIDGFMHRCLITKRYDKTILYIYDMEHGLPMETGWQGEWTTSGQDAQTFSAAAGIYEATGGGRYTIVGGAGYYIEIAGTNWRLFNASGDEVAMGPAMDQPMEGAYGTTQNPPGVGDSTLTVKLVNIIIPG